MVVVGGAEDDDAIDDGAKGSKECEGHVLKSGLSHQKGNKGGAAN